MADYNGTLLVFIEIEKSILIISLNVDRSFILVCESQGISVTRLNISLIGRSVVTRPIANALYNRYKSHPVQQTLTNTMKSKLASNWTTKIDGNVNNQSRPVDDQLMRSRQK